MIVYFGYTFCPDVRPTDLMAITQALDGLWSVPMASSLSSLPLISFSTIRSAAEYLAAFHKSFIGSTGSPREI